MPPSYEKQFDRFDTHATHIFQPGRAVTDLDDFLTQKKPSMTKDFNGAHWIVVCCRDTGDPEPEPEVLDNLVVSGQKILSKLEERIEVIEQDKAIPVKSNTKCGVPSKREQKTVVKDKARERLQVLASKTTSVGYWVFQHTAHRVDKTFRTLAESLIDGPLRKTSAYMIRVHTSPAGAGDKYKHTLQVWFDDVFDEEQAKDILDTLVDEHALRPESCRCELMRYLNLDRDDGLIDPWVHKAVEFFEDARHLTEALKTAREKLKTNRHHNDSEEDELASQPIIRNRKKGQLEPGQDKAPMSRSKDDRLGSANLGQGAYRLGGGSPGPDSSTSAERRSKVRPHPMYICDSPPPAHKRPKTSVAIKKEPPAVYSIDENGAICLD